MPKISQKEKRLRNVPLKNRVSSLLQIKVEKNDFLNELKACLINCLLESAYKVSVFG